ncbi:unnamed protein product, partial [Notodromas monacha]
IPSSNARAYLPKGVEEHSQFNVKNIGLHFGPSIFVNLAVFRKEAFLDPGKPDSSVRSFKVHAAPNRSRECFLEKPHDDEPWVSSRRALYCTLLLGAAVEVAMSNTECMTRKCPNDFPVARFTFMKLNGEFREVFVLGMRIVPLPGIAQLEDTRGEMGFSGIQPNLELFALSRMSSSSSHYFPIREEVENVHDEAVGSLARLDPVRARHGMWRNPGRLE